MVQKMLLLQFSKYVTCPEKILLFIFSIEKSNSRLETAGECADSQT